MKRVVPVFFWMLCVIGLLRAQDAPSFRVSVLNLYDTQQPAQVRVFSGANKFSLAAPRTLRLRTDQARQRLVFRNEEKQFELMLRLVQPSQSFDADSYRRLLAEIYPGAKLGEAASFMMNGKPGVAFDFSWQRPGGLMQSVHCGFVVFPEGTWEIGYISAQKSQPDAQSALNSLLLSFRINEPEDRPGAPKPTDNI